MVKSGVWNGYQPLVMTMLFGINAAKQPIALFYGMPNGVDVSQYHNKSNIEDTYFQFG